MNDVQSYLLKLVKEIDTICEKHDIDYYVFAGSMLGAERNEGFLPWDDDMDIVMTKKNYDKFKQVINSELPENRVFEDKENCSDYPLHFGKYTSVDTSNIIRSLAFGNCTAGIWIDIMYVAPMPIDEKKRKRVMRLFPCLCELENEFYVEYPYRYRGFQWRYRLLYLLSKFFGKKRVISYLKRACDNYSEEKCKDYFLYHSLDANFRIFSKECFGKPVRTKYENEYLNKSPENCRLCREGYGDGWMMVPRESQQLGHSTITDCDTPCAYYKADYMQFLDSNIVMNDFKIIKNAHIEKVHRERVAMDYYYRMEAEVVSIKTEAAIESYKIPFNELVIQQRYNEIGELFKEYIEFQWKSRIRNNNIFIHVKDEYLYGLMLYLICERQEYYSAEKLLMLRLDSGEAPSWANEIQSIILGLRNLSIKLWDEKDYDEVIKLCRENEKLIKKYNIRDYVHAYCIASMALKTCALDEIESICSDLIEENSRTDFTGIPEKILGDIYVLRGDSDVGLRYYKESKEYLRNGLLLLQLEETYRRIYND